MRVQRRFWGRHALTLAIASCSLSAYPRGGTGFAMRRSATASQPQLPHCTARQSTSSHARPALAFTTLSNFRTTSVRSSAMAMCMRSASDVREGARERKMKRKDKELVAEVGLGGGKIGVFSEPGYEEGWRRAQELDTLLAAGAQYDVECAKAEARVPALCAERAIVFWRRGPELLRRGEAPGKGLTCELDDVLRLQCVPGTLQSDSLVRACVGKKRQGSEAICLEIVDCTAGFGHDAIRLASAGHRVCALERDPFVFGFLSAGVHHLQHNEHTAALFEERVSADGGRLEVVCADAKAWLSARVREEQLVDVVYLDPMFPPKKRRSAMPKRRMQWLREHLKTGGGDGVVEGRELEELLETALQVGRKVVVKRADDGPAVGRPSSQITSTAVRYDIYVGRS